MANKERRKHKRASLELPLDVMDPAAKGQTIRAKTVNLSAGGFYCEVPFHVPVLTRLKVSMAIPVRNARGREEDHAVTCEGTVVRTVPEKPGPDVKTYEIGCFFTDIDDYDRLVIEQYLAERVLSES
jgi:c-di-GMP-binding flagellar brake protein YcgR